jgi:hypothetical protein
MAPFRILSLTHPIFCGYLTSCIRKRSDFFRKLSACIRRASDPDAARDAARPCPYGTDLIKKAKITLKKGLKKT